MDKLNNDKTNNDKKIPRPEDIQKEIEKLLKDKFDGNIKMFGMPGFGNIKDAKKTKAQDFESKVNQQPRKKIELDFNYKPRDIKAHLDRYVIKQDEAKKALAIAVCDHYNHVRECIDNPHLKKVDYAKQNVLLLGPTGVGKTYLIKHVAELIGVPFIKADATRFTETGYVGANVDDLIKDLVRQADGDISLAQYGIVYLDEADKLATPPSQGGRDVSGRGVQFGMLKLMEETEVNLRGSHDIASQMQSLMEFQSKGKVSKKVINTRHILFIVSGAFTGIDEIIGERLNQKKIGINSGLSEFSTEEQRLNIMAKASTEDFIKYGFEPEFIGRLPIRVACEPLKSDDLYQILTESEGSIIKQYKRSFKSYDIDLAFEDLALKEIAKKAEAEKTGARALMTVCEKILRGFKFELPSLPLKKFIVSLKVVNEPKKELNKLLKDKNYQERLKLFDRIRKFIIEFKEQNKINIDFTEAAVDLLLDKHKPKDPYLFLKDYLKGYEHGLKLIEQNSGLNKFLFDADVIQNPQKWIEEQIRVSYSKKDEISKSSNTKSDESKSEEKNNMSSTKI